MQNYGEIGVYEIHTKIGNIFATYVGSSINLASRRKSHLRELKKGTHRSKCFQDCYDQGNKFRFRIIDTISQDEYEANPRSLTTLEQYYMDTVKGIGILLNTTKYAGSPMRDPKIVAKMAASRTGKGHPHTLESKAKISAARKGKKYSPLSAEHRANISAANKGRRCSEKTKIKIGNANRGKKYGPLSDEHKAKISARFKGKKLSKEHRAKLSAARIGMSYGPHSAETRAKMSASHKRRLHKLRRRA